MSGYLYRGVHAGHPQFAAARSGVVIPGDQHGDVTPEMHNAGGVSADSPYTSWTGRLSVAELHAHSAGPGGLVLRVAGPPPYSAESWYWEDSPDELDEDEILLHG